MRRYEFTKKEVTITSSGKRRTYKRKVGHPRRDTLLRHLRKVGRKVHASGNLLVYIR